MGSALPVMSDLNSYKALRAWISKTYHIINLVRLPNESFGAHIGDVKVDTVIFVISSRSRHQMQTEVIGYSGYDRITAIENNTADIHFSVDHICWETAQDSIWSLNLQKEQENIIRKCEKNTIPLDECMDFSLGLTPYDKYKGHTQKQIKSRIFHAEHKIEKTFQKLLAGNDVRRYSVTWNGKEWINYGPWLGAPREQRFFTERRILVKQIIDWTTRRIWASITDEELYNTQNAFNLLPKSQFSLEYILGILNSKLMTFYHRKRFLDEFKMRFQKILIKDCKRFPIHVIEFANLQDKAKHNQLTELVELMLKVQAQMNKSKTPNEKSILKRKVESLDEQIDKLVYDLYSLSEGEIRTIEDEIMN